MTIENLLEDTIHIETSGSVRPDWHDVGQRVERRTVRRSRTQRAGVAMFVGVLGFLVTRTGYSRNVTADAPVVDQGDMPLIDRWPTSGEIIAASGSAPSAAEMWFFGLVIFGLPALVAWVMWFCAPDAMRQPIRRPRIGRWAIAITSGLLASLVMSLAIFVLMIVFYNPVAALARASLLTDTFAMSTSGVGVWALAFLVLVMVPTNQGPVRWARAGWSWAVFFILYSAAIGIASFAVSQLRWDAVRDLAPNRSPIRGLFAPMFSSDLSFEFEGADVAGTYMLTMFGLSALLVALLAWQAWTVLRSAVGAEVRRWDRLSGVGVRAAVQGKIFGVLSIVAALVVLVGFFGSTFLLHDQLADGLPTPATEVFRRVEVRRWSVLIDHDSPLVSAYYSVPGNGEGLSVGAMESALLEAGFERQGRIPYEWSRPRNDQYDADFVHLDEFDDGPLVVEATVFDTDGLLLSIPVTIISLALLALGMNSLRRRS